LGKHRVMARQLTVGFSRLRSAAEQVGCMRSLDEVVTLSRHAHDSTLFLICTQIVTSQIP